jgi:hypothetical protein
VVHEAFPVESVGGSIVVQVMITAALELELLAGPFVPNCAARQPYHRITGLRVSGLAPRWSA